ncbi:unnamed protein product [Zymoseptoria tritici ST99CH_3D1]|uniref:Uncharacterized protein n=1 Tax=Zymoseptoria tritici (strain CBS 115943 / IPO323) TaxID=336722 RepID=F9XFI2_ZYMTI|nr:uncharacterized protein MYCGRDRAFT_110301 [Zymoseptoria tritici IPO323]EGP85910.1 hypothetical protein MYCGRDRAFT_110301 [Zymoseptoria tritici IPO323]SMR58176.1 unnamed protein product [Zymoseptoria tritici ST99CH_3D1]
MSPSMSSTVLLRRTLTAATSTRSFSTTRRAPASLLFALGQLSNTRETQHFAKRSKLDHVEHSPPLQLIRSSEVDPFAPPKKVRATKAKDATAGTRAASIKEEFERNMAQSDGSGVAPLTGVRMNVDTSPCDAQLASVTQELTARLERSGRDIQDLEKGLAAVQKELGSLVKTLGIFMFLLVGGVTGVAMWNFWPQEKSGRTGEELGKKVAQRTRAARPLPAAGSLRRDVGIQTGLGATNAGLAEVMGEAAVLPVAASAVSAQPVAPGVQGVQSTQDEWRWYKNLFWKQR